MIEKSAGQTLLENAYKLSTPEDNVDYYDAFASTYDTDFADALGWHYPAAIAAAYRDPAPHLHRSCRQSSNEAGLLDACLRVDIYQDVLVSSHSRRLRGPRTLAPWRGRFVVRALFPTAA